MCIQRLIRFILNVLLLMVAITAMLACITKADIYSKMVHVALAVACVSAAFSKRYRYVWCSMALLIMFISFLCHKDMLYDMESDEFQNVCLLFYKL